VGQVLPAALPIGRHATGLACHLAAATTVVGRHNKNQASTDVSDSGRQYAAGAGRGNLLLLLLLLLLLFAAAEALNNQTAQQKDEQQLAIQC
jgi:hypothetical protein